MKNLLLSLFTLCFLFSVSQAQQPSQDLQWKEFSSETENFKILFPSTPKKSVEDLTITPTVKRQVIWFESFIPQKSFSVSFTIYPTLPTMNQEQLKANYQFLKNATIGTTNSKLLSEREIWLDKKQGYEIVVELKDSIVTNRMYLIGTKLYQVIATANMKISENEITKAKIKKFLDSFQIIEK